LMLNSTHCESPVLTNEDRVPSGKALRVCHWLGEEVEPEEAGDERGLTLPPAPQEKGPAVNRPRHFRTDSRCYQGFV
jgi:hypothetical protein